MAATLTSAGELLFASFPIDKVETDADGDLIVYGKASDGSIDSDQQIVDPSWMARAAQAWKESGANLRVQHNAQRDPAGVGLEVETDANGATWVKGLVVEPIAKKLVAKGALRAYSVGIARPTIARDAAARGGRITDGELVEISLVDRPANKRCGIQLVKSADDGTPEYVNEVFGTEADIAKALGTDATKAAADSDDFVSVDLPPGASISISPADFARLRTFKQQLVTKTAGADTEKRDVSTAERRSLASEGNALPDGSYPINSTGDLHNAAHLARTGHGDAAAARRLIARRARELGVANPLDESDKSDDVAKSEAAAEAPSVQTPEERLLHDIFAEKAADAPAEQQEAAPDVTKEPKPKPVKKAKKPKKMPPWLNKPKDGDSDGDSKGDSDDDASKACKSVSDHLWTASVTWFPDGPVNEVFCSKCHTTPAQAAGVTAAPMDPAPVKELLESDGPASTKGATPASASGAVAEHMNPVPRHREPDGAPMEAFEKDSGMSDGDSEAPTKLEAPTLKSSPEVAALMRFRAAGIDPELGKLHDLTCPAYHPDEVAKYHPFADLATLIDEGAWQRKAVAAACGPIEHALKMHALAEAAQALKAADPALVNDWRLEAHKAFRDANPGPGTYPTPGSISAQRYCRPVLTEGRAANSPGHGPPNTSPQVATSAPNAHSFDRPPLSDAHASPSPSFMKGGFAYPSEQGVPTQLTYARQQQEQAHEALALMHTHVGSMFPQVCPMDLNEPGPSAKHPVPPTAGIGKGDGVETRLEPGEGILPKSAIPAVAVAFKATPEDADFFADADIYKGFKKMRKKLGKKVLSGSMTVDEARAKLGRQFAQKGADEPQEAVQKSAALSPPPSVPELLAPPVAPPPVAASFDPEVIKAAVADATSELKDLLVKQQETFTTKLAEQQRVIDAIADQPDPSTASFSGLAFNPLRKSARPAGVTEIAEAAARAQRATMRELENLYNSSSDPAAREAYYATLTKMQGGTTP